MCSSRETYLACYFPSLGMKVPRGFGQEVSIFFPSEISMRSSIGLEREVTMGCLVQIGTAGTFSGYSGLLCERLFLGGCNTYTHSLTPERDLQQTKVTIISKSNLASHWVFIGVTYRSVVRGDLQKQG